MVTMKTPLPGVQPPSGHADATKGSYPRSRQSRSYQAPQLVIYGNLAELTRLVGNDGDDGSIGTRIKT